MTNSFEALAERQTPAPVKRRQEQAEKRRAAAAAAEQEQKDDLVLTKLYAAHKRKERDALLAGPHGENVSKLLAFLRRMDLDSAPELIGIVDDAGWIAVLTIDERHTLFGAMARAVARCRERAGLPPYDDGQWDEPPKALHQIKDRMGIR